MPERATRRERTVVYYTQTCVGCGKEIEFEKDTVENRCYDCKTLDAIDAAKVKLSYLIGAKVTSVEPVVNGHCTDDKSIKEIKLTLADGTDVVIEIGGWDDQYMRMGIASSGKVVKKTFLGTLTRQV